MKHQPGPPPPLLAPPGVRWTVSQSTGVEELRDSAGSGWTGTVHLFLSSVALLRADPCTVPCPSTCTFKLQQRQEVLVIKQVVGLGFVFCRCMVVA